MQFSYATLFLTLVLIQGLHSIEEYVGKLWETFPPAAALCGLISTDLEMGFMVINIGLFIFGLLSFVIILKAKIAMVRGLIWFWITIELINGIGHPIWSVFQGAYTPGLLTSPFLLIISLFLYRSYVQQY